MIPQSALRRVQTALKAQGGRKSSDVYSFECQYFTPRAMAKTEGEEEEGSRSNGTDIQMQRSNEEGGRKQQQQQPPGGPGQEGGAKAGGSTAGGTVEGLALAVGGTKVGVDLLAVGEEAARRRGVVQGAGANVLALDGIGAVQILPLGAGELGGVGFLVLGKARFALRRGRARRAGVGAISVGLEVCIAHSRRGGRRRLRVARPRKEDVKSKPCQQRQGDSDRSE